MAPQVALPIYIANMLTGKSLKAKSMEDDAFYDTLAIFYIGFRRPTGNLKSIGFFDREGAILNEDSAAWRRRLLCLSTSPICSLARASRPSPWRTTRSMTHWQYFTLGLYHVESHVSQ